MVIPINIQEQREMLCSRFRVELLTSDESNKEKIQSFRADKRGRGLERYLKEDAWDEDQKGVTKVYLVKDADDIVSFFALSAGLLYREINSDDYKLSESEKEIVDLCVDARLRGSNSITVDEVFSWYTNESVNQDKLRIIIDDRIRFKLAAQEDKEISGNSINVRQVAETFPGIVLTHFCKSLFKKKCVLYLYTISVYSIILLLQSLGCSSTPFSYYFPY